jgi:L-aminopeptidase/D-esterase-like protein
MSMKLTNSIIDVSGIKVGHAQDIDALTGCTVVLCEKGAVGGVDQRGGAPGTRETDLLHPSHLVSQVHAILLSGGSAFGLDAAGGVVHYLEEKGIGFNSGAARVPIVPAAIIYDLSIGKPDIRPGFEMGYQACCNATDKLPAEGNVGAGTGATVGKIMGMAGAMKSGIGSASLEITQGVVVGAIAVVNAFGDVIDPSNGQIIAGARMIRRGLLQIGSGPVFADTLLVMKSFVGRTVLNFAMRENTVIGVVATNAKLTKEQVNKVAQMAHDGLARTIRPSHTMLDGDTIFALSTGNRHVDVNTIGAYAAEAFTLAILKGVKNAKPIAGLPAYGFDQQD